MSTGSLSFIGSAAGSTLAQTKGSDVARAQQDTTSQVRRAESERHAEDAAGIGQTDHDEQAGERDADGRRIWEIGPDGQRRRKSLTPEAIAAELQRSKDPTGQSGKQLDLSG